ncbi:MAG: hypothetical protein AB9882_11995 [Ignavibacteriaceae bacterium]
MKKLIALVFIILIVNSFSQSDTTTSQGGGSSVISTVQSWIKISGEAGTYGEVYSISGMSSRRPPSTGRIFIRPVLTILDNFNLAFDFFLSTEGSAAKQQMDQIGIHPAWGWGQAHIGDFSQDFSRYTLSGITIRGGGVEINPGIFRLQIVGGQSQRMVDNGPYESAYARYLVGLKIGIGKSESSFFDINIVRTRDDLSSISRDKFMSFQKDSIQVDSGYISKVDTIYSGVTPQENLIVGTNFQLKLFSGMIQLRGEAAGSVYTKDMYSQDFKIEKMPEIVGEIYTAKLSSNLDYAYNADLIFQERTVNAKIGYRLIGPGYTSLGLPSLINDKKIIDGGLGLNLYQGTLIIQTKYGRQTDNVVKQKLFTITRNEFAVTTSIRPAREVMLTVNFVNNSFENDNTNDTLKLSNLNNAYNFTGTYQFGLFNLNHIVLASYAYQVYKDKNILRLDNNVNSQNVMLNLSTMISQDWTVSTGFQLNTVSVQTQNNSTLGLSARVTNKMFSNRLNNSLSYSFNSSSASTSNNFQIQSMFSLDQSNTIALSVRTNIFSGKAPMKYNFVENVGSLAYTYRF